MAKSNSTALPQGAGRQYRRLYMTAHATVSALAELHEAQGDPDKQQLFNTLIDSFEILMSSLESQLDQLCVPRDWRGK